jgi:hypothetical protein
VRHFLEGKRCGQYAPAVRNTVAIGPPCSWLLNVRPRFGPPPRHNHRSCWQVCRALAQSEYPPHEWLPTLREMPASTLEELINAISTPQPDANPTPTEPAAAPPPTVPDR